MLFGQCPHGGGDKLKGASLIGSEAELPHKFGALFHIYFKKSMFQW